MASAARHVLSLLLLTGLRGQVVGMTAAPGLLAEVLDQDAAAACPAGATSELCEGGTSVSLLQQASALTSSADAAHASRSVPLPSNAVLAPTSNASDASVAAAVTANASKAAGAASKLVLADVIHGSSGNAAGKVIPDGARLGSASLYLLPFLGIAAAAGAILATIAFTQRFGSGPEPDCRQLSAEQVERLRNAMQAHHGDRRLPAPFGGAAEALLPPMRGGPEPLPPRKAFIPPPPQAPQSDAPAGPQGPLGPGRHPGDAPGTVKIIALFPLEGGRFGLNLREQDLTVTGFADPRTRLIGLLIGDRIIAVSGIPVISQASFVEALQAAVDRNGTYGDPIVFTAVPSNGDPADVAPMLQAGATPAVNPELEEQLLGAWMYGDFTEGEAYSYTIARMNGDGPLDFEQVLPDGMAVRGFLVWAGTGYMTDLVTPSGELYAQVRLRPQAASAGLELVSNLIRAGEKAWGEDIVARKVPSLASAAPPESGVKNPFAPAVAPPTTWPGATPVSQSVLSPVTSQVPPSPAPLTPGVPAGGNPFASVAAAATQSMAAATQVPTAFPSLSPIQSQGAAPVVNPFSSDYAGMAAPTLSAHLPPALASTTMNSPQA